MNNETKMNNESILETPPIYEAPEIEIVEVMAEQGFQLSDADGGHSW